MAALKEVVDFLDKLLDINSTPGDASNNGLQVEASEDIRTAVFSVDASMELFEKAAAVNADFIFVHHGMSWGAEPRRFNGPVAARLKLLFANRMSLYGAHLPLDAHPEIGHNALLASYAGLADRKGCFEYSGVQVGVCGRLSKKMSVAELAAVYEHKLDCQAEIFGTPERELEKISVVSGGAGLGGLMDAFCHGVDCFITGEVDHTMYPWIKETGVDVIKLGHYKSEIPGVAAVMEELGRKFDIACDFVDVPTGL
ncbi:Nif3-like dinuclear metal center hexameric protein [Lentisphaerota bacterium ZTH]|nr:Nif3-like dinuclear metal center hexameric protein [Lentisphaerota bacterium]WET05851.1 Nif3-like dinuclear metal center hexameric protein [Lentisphaerota bacterium ZTH]